MDDDLEALVALAQTGDERAFERLVERFHLRIYRWALVITLDQDEADDVVQEVCIRLYRFIGSYSGESKFTTWLFRMTHNAAINYKKRSARSEDIAARVSRALGSLTFESADAEADRSRILEMVRHFAEKLPAAQRIVFDLADLQGHAPVEIAAMIGVKPVTVRTNLHKARVAMRTWLLQHDPDIAEDMV